MSGVTSIGLELHGSSGKERATQNVIRVGEGAACVGVRTHRIANDRRFLVEDVLHASPQREGIIYVETDGFIEVAISPDFVTQKEIVLVD